MTLEEAINQTFSGIAPGHDSARAFAVYDREIRNIPLASHCGRKIFLLVWNAVQVEACQAAVGIYDDLWFYIREEASLIYYG